MNVARCCAMPRTPRTRISQCKPFTATEAYPHFICGAKILLIFCRFCFALSNSVNGLIFVWEMASSPKTSSAQAHRPNKKKIRTFVLRSTIASNQTRKTTTTKSEAALINYRILLFPLFSARNECEAFLLLMARSETMKSSNADAYEMKSESSFHQIQSRECMSQTMYYICSQQYNGN